MSDADQDRLRRVERKIDTLKWMMWAQLAISAVIVLVYILRSVPTLLIVAVVILAIAMVFRDQLPSWLTQWLPGSSQKRAAGDPIPPEPPQPGAPQE